MNQAMDETIKDKIAFQGADASAESLALRIPLSLVFVVFLISGFASLLYQIVWQRSLFTIYGTNMEAITVVVAAFMLGLGLGSLAGGFVSRRPERPLLCIFGLMELGIACYGFFSLQLFSWVGNQTGVLSPVWIGLVTFGLLLIPTLFMGATLPLLVATLAHRNGNVGHTVGWLYFINTLGAAIGAFAAVLYFLVYHGLTGSVRLAALFNLMVGTTIIVAHFLTRRSR